MVACEERPEMSLGKCDTLVGLHEPTLAVSGATRPDFQGARKHLRPEIQRERFLRRLSSRAVQMRGVQLQWGRMCHILVRLDCAAIVKVEDCKPSAVGFLCCVGLEEHSCERGERGHFLQQLQPGEGLRFLLVRRNASSTQGLVPGSIALFEDRRQLAERHVLANVHHTCGVAQADCVGLVGSYWGVRRPVQDLLWDDVRLPRTA
mmetsp:Transcript_122408/g.391656  ORF Transcript_122408/g.391656 Transcript_122408/m.391656 type:complete len:205 (-) Transcript_122408:497-1111(-)